MKKHLIILLALAWLLVPLGARADVVELKNGDRISGQILKMSGEKLLIKTEYAGKLSIAWSQVTALSSEKPLLVDMGHGGKITGAASPAGAGQVKLGQGTDAQVVELAQVAAINPRDKTKLRIKGQVNMGIDLREGNTVKDRWDLDGQITLSKNIHRFIIGAESHRETNKSKDTVDNDLAFLAYNRFIDKKWYALGNSRYSQDKFKGIKYRYGLGAGLGYQFWDTELSSLKIELGPTYIWEETNAWGQMDYMAARWFIGYDQWLFDKWVQFFINYALFVRVDNADQYFFNGRTGLRMPLGWGVVASVVYAYDWDNDPDPGKKKEDTRLTFKLGYAW